MFRNEFGESLGERIFTAVVDRASLVMMLFPPPAFVGNIFSTFFIFMILYPPVAWLLTIPLGYIGELIQPGIQWVGDHAAALSEEKDTQLYEVAWLVVKFVITVPFYLMHEALSGFGNHYFWPTDGWTLEGLGELFGYWCLYTLSWLVFFAYFIVFTGYNTAGEVVWQMLGVIKDEDAVGRW